VNQDGSIKVWRPASNFAGPSFTGCTVRQDEGTGLGAHGGRQALPIAAAAAVREDPVQDAVRWTGISDRRADGRFRLRQMVT